MLRLSYTAFNYWLKGDTNGLIEYLNGKRFEPTSQMKAGLQMDIEACEAAVQTGKLPDHFGGFKMYDPQPQLKMETNFDSFQLVGVMDVYDQGMIYELKTGVTSSAEYARTLQVPLYALLLRHPKTVFYTEVKGEWVQTEPKLYPTTGGRICRFNQYEGTTDIHQLIIGEGLINQTYDTVVELAWDIESFLKRI